jgi:hypothetical protein
LSIQYGSVKGEPIMVRAIRLATSCVVTIVALTGQIQAGMVTFSTSDSQFTTGVHNQGWWSATASNTATNDNYFVGRLSDHVRNNFFSFDLSSLDLSGMQIASATLELRRAESAGNLPHTYNLFDVSTAPAVLNNNVGTGVAIFNDLGSGTSYGSFVIGAGNASDILSLSLNAAALADIANASGNFFSIGGTLDLTGKSGDQFLFGSSQGHAQQLIIELTPESPVIPEPSSLALLGIGSIGIALGAYRRRRQQKLP